MLLQYNNLIIILFKHVIIKYFNDHNKNLLNYFNYYQGHELLKILALVVINN